MRQGEIKEALKLLQAHVQDHAKDRKAVDRLREGLIATYRQKSASEAWKEASDQADKLLLQAEEDPAMYQQAAEILDDFQLAHPDEDFLAEFAVEDISRKYFDRTRNLLRRKNLNIILDDPPVCDDPPVTEDGTVAPTPAPEPEKVIEKMPDPEPAPEPPPVYDFNF